MSASKDFADALAASVPADQRQSLFEEESARTLRGVAQLAEAFGLGPEETFTPRQRRAAVALVQGASRDTLAAVAALLRTLSAD